MSYDVSMAYPDGRECRVDRREDGGTYILGGTDEAMLNITYNYSPHFYSTLDKEKGLRWLYGKTGRDTGSRLADAVTILGTERNADYWKNTPGNAGYALSILLLWARQHPDAVFDGD